VSQCPLYYAMTKLASTELFMFHFLLAVTSYIVIYNNCNIYLELQVVDMRLWAVMSVSG
jgi:hypothetical protein